MGRRGSVFWGIALVVLGVVWLLSNLGIVPENWWELILPVLLVAWGVAIWLGSRGAGLS